MQSDEVRRAYTSQGFLAFAAYTGNVSTYELSNINLGNNSNSRLEVVSSLNLFNLAFNQYHFNYQNCYQKYNPKVYLGAVQSVALGWYYDYQNDQNIAEKYEKSGSWPLKKLLLLKYSF